MATKKILKRICNPLKMRGPQHEVEGLRIGRIVFVLFFFLIISPLFVSEVLLGKDEGSLSGKEAVIIDDFLNEGSLSTWNFSSKYWDTIEKKGKSYPGAKVDLS